MKHGCLSMLVFVTIVLTILGGAAIVATSVNAESPPAVAPTTTPSTQPIDYEAYDREQAFKLVQEALGKTGDVRDEVLTVRYPRNDLDITIDGMAVPAAAGFETTFQFYFCPCGKLKVVGHYVLAEYEMNDVVDALRKGNGLRIASVGPMVLDEKPRLMQVRFQGEGDGNTIGTMLKDSFNSIGAARIQKAPGM